MHDSQSDRAFHYLSPLHLCRNPHASQLNKPHTCTFPFCHAPIIPENHSSHHSMPFQRPFCPCRVISSPFQICTTNSRLSNSSLQPIHMHDSIKIATCLDIAHAVRPPPQKPIHSSSFMHSHLTCAIPAQFLMMAVTFPFYKTMHISHNKASSIIP